MTLLHQRTTWIPAMLDTLRKGFRLFLMCFGVSSPEKKKPAPAPPAPRPNSTEQ